MVTKESLEAVGLTGWPKTSGLRGIHIRPDRAEVDLPEVRRAALAIARDVEARAPGIATSKWWKEERHGVFLDYNQNAKDRTVASAYSVRPLPDARVSTPLSWDEVLTVEAEAFTLQTVPARFAEIGDPGAGIDGAVGSLEAVLEPRSGTRPRKQGRAVASPNYRKQEGEPPRVQPSAAPQDRGLRHAGSRGGAGEERAAMEKRFLAEAERRAPRRPLDADPVQTHPDGSTAFSVPVIEISRARTKAEALEGLERWKSKHPKAAAALEEADVLVDGMRGRSSLWYRVRVNLIHVPESERPEQAELEVDYDPWAEYAYPDRAGQLERAPRKRAAKKAGTSPESEPSAAPPRLDRDQCAAAGRLGPLRGCRTLGGVVPFAEEILFVSGPPGSARSTASGRCWAACPTSPSGR